ncbi:MAG: GW dipeptide domain-containing protein [Saprospiraceae bacterium]|nr:GW dipeptide domain-containing protein [Saprospiraceae bacterium]
MQITKFIALILFGLALPACGSKPKVIEAESNGAQSKAPIFQDVPNGAATPEGNAAPQDMSAAEHKVVVAEALNTEKYTYLRVKENQEEFWIAITKRPVKIGSTCYYRGGLLKKNFQSKEFNRVFETVYLVGEFREEGAETSPAVGGIPAAAEALAPPKNVQRAPGAIKISDLVANASKYAGKTVKITGKCVKINPMIMGRNWLHIQDGSGKNLDLTVTTTEMIELGSIVTLEGVVAVNKDFGAGYKYDYILEAAVLK